MASGTRLWSFASRGVMAPLQTASADMAFCSSGGRDKNRTALERAGMNGFEHPVDVVQRVLLDEWHDLDAAAEHQFQRLRIEFRRTAPVADRAGMESHQVRQPDLDLVHGEPDDGERRTA